ncbi:MAG: tetratricopeptide repeat protein [Elusimicrobia bacterium]|nr:tetratricopeptide repeat protein [Elusimicrobiota bacterium]
MNENKKTDDMKIETKAASYRKEADLTKTKVLLNKAKNRMQRKKYDEALKLYTEASEIESDVPSIYAEMGFAKYHLGKEDALSDIAKVLEMDSECEKAFLYRAYIRAETEDISGAQADLDKAFSINDKIKRDFTYSKVKMAIKRQQRKNK